jgi:hypothetical protein
MARDATDKRLTEKQLTRLIEKYGPADSVLHSAEGERVGYRTLDPVSGNRAEKDLARRALERRRRAAGAQRAAGA